MSESVIFDTHRFIKDITETGISQSSAEAIVNTVAHVLEHNLATKQDIELLRAEMNALALQTKNDLIKWLVGTLLAFSTIIVAAVLGGLQLLL